MDSLGSAAETLAQMRVRSADAANEAYEMFRSNANTQGMGQMPPPPPQEDGERSEMDKEQMAPPPLPNDGAYPTQQVVEEEEEKEQAPIAAITAGIA